MKTFRLFIMVLTAITISVTASAQSQAQPGKATPVTETFKVWGKCDMCKARIEKTAVAAGAETASWEAKTQKLTVTYDPAKTGRDALSKKLAAVGHDTEKYKAPDEVYDKLPACCHYDRSK
jgi:maltose-binding protein MalE